MTRANTRLAACIVVVVAPCVGQVAVRAQQVSTVNANAQVVLLEPSSFPQLPQKIRADLQRRGCRIPQVRMFTDDTLPHNVVSGSFTAARSSEWAVLCSRSDTSSILVYADTAASPRDSLERAPDRSFMQGAGEFGVAFSRKLGTAPPAYIRRQYEVLASAGAPVPPEPLDHDGIADAYMGKGSDVLYFHRGRWLLLAGADEAARR